jgi:hypothetical protein
MKANTRIVVIGVLIIPPVAFTLGVGIAAVSDMLSEDKKKHKETPPQTSGPKVEKIKNPIRRKKVYIKFEDIVNRY